MERTVILPTPADPFLVNYWLLNYAKWADEIDQLIIVANTPSLESLQYLEQRVKDFPHILFIPIDHQIEHGDAIKVGLEHVKTKYVGLIEDDGFVVRKGAIGSAFSALNENIRIVGSKRGSCASEILKKAQRKYELSYEGYGDQGPNFWPCFFFTETELLRGVSNYAAKFWPRGSQIAGLDGVCMEDCYSDTFVEASLELRTKVSNEQIEYRYQGHAHPADLEHYEENSHIFNGMTEWIHIGSLSSGFHGLLRNEYGKVLARRFQDDVQGIELQNAPSNDSEKMEYERRVQMWLTAYDNRQQGYLEDLAHDYWWGLNNIVAQFHLSMKRILRRQVIYKLAFNL